MKTEHRTLLAIVLSMAAFLAWYTYFGPTKKADVKQEIEREQTTSNPQTIAKTEEAVPKQAVAKEEKTGAAESKETNDPQRNLPVKTWDIKNDLIEATFTSDGGIPTSWKIVGYRTKADNNSPYIDMVPTSKEEGFYPLDLSFDDAEFSFPKRPRYELVSASKDAVQFKWRSKDIEVVKDIRFSSENYTSDVTITLKNLSDKPFKCRPVLYWGGLLLPASGGGFLGLGQQQPVESMNLVYFLDGKASRETSVSKIGKQGEKVGLLRWTGLESRYFLGSIVPRVANDASTTVFGSSIVEGAAKGVSFLWTGAKSPQVVLPVGEGKSVNYTAYVGPKEINRLKSVGVKLEDAIDYGWFTVVAIPILYALRFFYGIIHNYGIAIILLTIFVKLLLHPINVKSLKSMKGMQKLQPILKELQKKYKEDKQRLNQETMMLFKAHKVNPMGGCLPMLVQFPIYIALYKVLWNSIELFHAPFFWFYKDLSAPDPYFITPVLLGLFMVAQQKLTPSASGDPTQQKMMMMMPVMFSVFMLFLPVGLVVYILVNTVMSVVQQWMYNQDILLRDLFRGKFPKFGAAVK